MRTIKFRIWDGEDMLPMGDSIEFRNALFHKIRVTHKYDDLREPDCKDFHLMQFTGLKDRNGKEVYEGDVVRIVFNQNANSYNGSNVNLTEHICIVEYNAAMAGFCLRNTTDKTPNKHNFKVISFNHYRLRDVKEIIGNVHENPELLTTKK